MADNTRLNQETTSGDLISTDDITGGVADGSKVQRVKPGFGIDGSFADVSLGSPLPVVPGPLGMGDIASGDISGMGALNKFGQNIDVDSAALEDIWDGGGLYDFPTTASTYEIASANGADDIAGTGARQVLVSGLDASYAEISEIVDMNFVGTAVTSLSFLRIFRMIVVAVGSGGENAGDIIASPVGGGSVAAQILAGKNQTLMAIYTVPAGRTLLLYSILTSVYNSATKGYGEIEFRARSFGGAFAIKVNCGLASDGNSSFQRSYVVPLVFAEKTDLKMSARVSVNNTLVIGAFDGILKDN